MLGSLRAYAAHRKSLGLPGGSHPAVRKAIQSGRIKVSANGQIEFEQADHDWEQNSDHRQQRHVRMPGQATRRAKDKPAENTEISAAPGNQLPLPDENSESFFEAQRRHEWLKVQKEELALKVRRGELIDVAEVEQKYGTAMKTFRNRMLLLPDILGPRVAVSSDPRECVDLISREIIQLLTSFQEYNPHAA